MGQDEARILDNGGMQRFVDYWVWACCLGLVRDNGGFSSGSSSYR